MATRNWRGMSDEDLIEAADRGMGGSGAVIEMLRRLQNKLLTRLMIGLAALGVTFAGIQAYLQWLTLPCAK
jgi:hypothetical protein